MTVNQLYVKLEKLMKRGYKRREVCIRKDTFSHRLEDEAVVILPVVDVGVMTYGIADDDGSAKINKDGSERQRTGVVLFGEKQ